MLAILISVVTSKQLVKSFGSEYRQRDEISTLDVAEKLVSTICEGNSEYISTEELLQCLKDLDEEDGKKFGKFMKKMLHSAIEFIIYKYDNENSNIHPDDYDIEEVNFAIPSWVVAALKWLLQEFIKEVVSKYQVKIYWDAHYKNEYKACIISLIHEEQITRTTLTGETIAYKNAFASYVKDSFNKIIGNKFPVKLKFENYNGNPSAVIYWK